MLTKNEYLEKLDKTYHSNDKLLFEDIEGKDIALLTLFFKDEDLYIGMIPAFFIETIGNSIEEVKKNLEGLVYKTLSLNALRAKNKESCRNDFVNHYGPKEVYELIKKLFPNNDIDEMIKNANTVKKYLFDYYWDKYKDKREEVLRNINSHNTNYYSPQMNNEIDLSDNEFFFKAS